MTSTKQVDKQSLETTSSPFVETKGDKLEKYMKRPLNEFIQLDAFIYENPSPVLAMQPDPDGDKLFGTRTDELMHGSDVRLFIKPGTEKMDILRVLDKFKADIKDDEGMYHWINKQDSKLVNKKRVEE